MFIGDFSLRYVSFPILNFTETKILPIRLATKYQRFMREQSLNIVMKIRQNTDSSGVSSTRR